MKSADLYMTFVIMLTDTIPDMAMDMARSGVSMRYFSPRYRKKDQKKRISTPWGGGSVARGVGMQICMLLNLVRTHTAVCVCTHT